MTQPIFHHKKKEVYVQSKGKFRHQLARYHDFIFSVGKKINKLPSSFDVRLNRK